MKRKKKHRKTEYTAPIQSEPLEPYQIIIGLIVFLTWFGVPWYYANGSWGLWIILVIVLSPLIYMFAPLVAAVGLALSVTIDALRHKLAQSRKVQHVNTSRPYDIADIRKQARQAAGLTDEP